jgi:hypothetical protein
MYNLVKKSMSNIKTTLRCDNAVPIQPTSVDLNPISPVPTDPALANPVTVNPIHTVSTSTMPVDPDPINPVPVCIVFANSVPSNSTPTPFVHPVPADSATANSGPVTCINTIDITPTEHVHINPMLHTLITLLICQALISASLLVYSMNFALASSTHANLVLLMFCFVLFSSFGVRESWRESLGSRTRVFTI